MMSENHTKKEISFLFVFVAKDFFLKYLSSIKDNYSVIERNEEKVEEEEEIKTK